MKPIRIHAGDLKKFLQTNKIATIDELKEVLGTDARMTVLRKLKELVYQTSYSHRGSYYTLKQLCRFDKEGLWKYNEACFSIYGTLLETGKAFIDESDAGYSTAELEDKLHVTTKEALYHLHKRGLIYREKISRTIYYFSITNKIRKKQIINRKSQVAVGVSFSDQDRDVLAHELKAAIILFFSLLDERQRRLFAGLESIKCGRGGDVRISELLGVDPHTVARGRCELLDRDVEIERIRKSGAGRKTVEKKHRKSSIILKV